MPTKYKQNPDDEPIIASITTQLESRLGEWFGRNSRFLRKEPEIITYPSSFFLRYTILVSQYHKKYILAKIRRKPKMHSIAQTMINPDLHINMPMEYNSLKVVYDNKEKLQNGLGAIQPLLYYQPLNAIVMEECPSVTLGQLLTNWETAVLQSKKKLDNLHDAALKTGKWLYSFHHAIYTSHETEFSTENFIQDINDLAKRLEITSHKKILVRFICELFSKKIHNPPCKRIPYSITHGDMTCDNVLYTKDKTVFVVDIKSKPASVYSDLGIILIHPETYITQVLSLGLFIHENTLKEYRNAILDGYFGDNPVEWELLDLYCGLNLLDKWVMYEEVFFRQERVKRMISIILIPIFRLYFISRIKKYLTPPKQEIN